MCRKIGNRTRSGTRFVLRLFTYSWPSVHLRLTSFLHRFTSFLLDEFLMFRLIFFIYKHWGKLISDREWRSVISFRVLRCFVKRDRKSYGLGVTTCHGPGIFLELYTNILLSLSQWIFSEFSRPPWPFHFESESTLYCTSLDSLDISMTKVGDKSRDKMFVYLTVISRFH